MRRLPRPLAGATLASLWLSGCWLQVGFDAGHSRHNGGETTITVENVDTLTVAWSTQVGAHSTSEPIVHGNRVYLSTSTAPGAWLKSLSLDSGAEMWSQGNSSSADVNFVTPPSFVGGRLWSGATFANFHPLYGFPEGSWSQPIAYDPVDGSGELSGSGFIASPATESEGRVVQNIVDVDSSGFPQRVEVRAAETFDVLWSDQIGSFQSTYDSAPAIIDGQVFVPLGSSIRAYDLDGCGAPTCQPTWTATGSQNVAGVLGGETVFVRVGAELRALDRETGAVVWSAPLVANAGGLAIADGTVFVTAGSSLLAFPADGCGAATCAPTWEAALSAATTSGPTVAGGVVYVGVESVIDTFAAAGCGAPACQALAHLGGVSGTVGSIVVTDGRVLVVHQALDFSRSDLTVFVPE